MPSPSLCGQLKTELNVIRALADSFDAAFERAKETGDMTEAHALKAQLEEKTASLKEKLSVFKWQSFDRRFLSFIEKKEQYKAVETLTGHTNSVLTLQAIPDGRIVSGGSDNTMTEFHLSTEALRVLFHLTNEIQFNTMQGWIKPY